METFEEFSKKIDWIAAWFPKSRVVRRYCRIERWVRHKMNEPLRFEQVGGEGWKVGEPIWVYHPTLHEIMPHAVRGELTDKVLMEGLRANAFQNLGQEQLEQHYGRSMIQPRWVEP